MRGPRRDGPVALALMLALLTTSCGIFSVLLFRKKPISRNGKPITSEQKIMTATRDELLARIVRVYDAIHSFQTTVEMTPSIGSVYKGEINEVPDVKAFILFRKPSDIRIQAQLPVVRTQAFDMVSNGVDFKFFLTSKNLFFEGANDAPATSKNQYENLRPKAFLASMLVMPPTAEESPLLTDLTDSENALYVIHLIRRMPNGELRASRQIWFERLYLTIVRQMAFDETGSIVSDTRYNNWQNYSGVAFPAHIDISRPIDGYGVVIDIGQMQMNKELTDDQFVLAKPEGSQLQVIGAPKQEPH
ncbi:MAG TPA: hypothetical protein VFC21_00770 [Bryobacteraceae bacterium]|nr:hypothetical protein [Bryobacteraceae bacterium]